MRLQAQPYRKGARQPSLALAAMLKGRSAGGQNSADITRGTQALLRAAKAKRHHRARPPRPKRAPRPPR